MELTRHYELSQLLDRIVKELEEAQKLSQIIKLDFESSKLINSSKVGLDTLNFFLKQKLYV